MGITIPDSVPQHNPSRKKQCKGCYLWLTLNNFGVDTGMSDGLFYKCRACCARHRKENYDPNKARARRLRQYGITPKQYEQMLVEQGGVCAVCKMPETHIRNHLSAKTGETRLLSVDHDHKNGDARAILCSGCNVALGRMNEDPERIRALADYAEWCQTREPSRKIIQLPLL